MLGPFATASRRYIVSLRCR